MSFFDEEIILTKVPFKNKGAIEMVIAFPNTYSVGMSSLGYQNAWYLFNQNNDLKAIRWFTNIQEKTCSKPNYIGFSFSWELDYKNIFSILEKNNISIYSNDRVDGDPIVFCGGQVPNANPEPFCDNFDFFLIGDLEVLAPILTNKLLEIKDLARDEKLIEIAKLPGIYAPRWKGLTNKASTKRQFTTGRLTHSSILTPNCVWPNTFLVEVVRSCPELCRFCLASYGSLPFRAPDLKEGLIPTIDFGLQHTNKVGLLGASVTQHPEFEKLIDYLLTRHTGTLPLQVQIASIRVDTISKNLTSGLYKLGAKSITMAVETGSSKLREIINKKVSNETIIKSIETIYNTGFNSIKLYGMVGLPHETWNDLKQTVDLLRQVKYRNKTKKLIWGCSVFVPKAGTPFQWYGVDSGSVEKLKYLAKELHQIGVEFRFESYRWAKVQAFISRGNKSINKILEQAYRYGSTLGSFNKAINQNKKDIDSNFIVHKTWEENFPLPWENIQGYLNKELVKEHSRKVSELANV